MSVISWGKCTIKHKTAGSTGTYSALDIPVEGSTSLESTEGEEKKATEEGGGIVDVIYGKSEVSLVFDLFLKKPATGETFSIPLDPHDGIVEGEHSFQLIPEDDDCVGIQIDKARVTTTPIFSSEEGLKMRYTCKALKPDSGDMVKIQVIS